MAHESGSERTDDQFWKLMGQLPVPAEADIPADPFILPNNRILVHVTDSTLHTLQDRIENYAETLTEAVNNLTFVGLAVAKLDIFPIAYRAVSDGEKVHWELPHYDLPAVDESTLPTDRRAPKKINVAVAEGRLAEFALFESIYKCNKEVAVNALMDFGRRTYAAMRDEEFYIAIKTDESIGIIPHPDHRDTLVLPHPDHFLD